MDAYWALARRAAVEGTRLPVQDGSALVRWAPQNQHPLTLPSPAGRGERVGPEIWAQVSETGEVIGATPFFSTGAAHALAVTGIGEDPEEALAGWIDGWFDTADIVEPYYVDFLMRVSLLDVDVVRSRLFEF